MDDKSSLKGRRFIQFTLRDLAVSIVLVGIVVAYLRSSLALLYVFRFDPNLLENRTLVVLAFC